MTPTKRNYLTLDEVPPMELDYVTSIASTTFITAKEVTEFMNEIDDWEIEQLTPKLTNLYND